MNDTDRKSDYLSQEALEWWKRNAWENMSASAETILLGVCEAFDRMKQAQEILRVEGLTVRDRYVWRVSVLLALSLVRSTLGRQQHCGLG